MKTLTLSIGLSLTIGTLPASALTVRLYQPDLTLTPDTSIADAGPWLNFGRSGVNATQTSQGISGTLLNTTNNNALAAGYSNYNASTPPPFPAVPTTFINPAFPTLDRVAGYTLSFNVAILSETSTSNNRAGFSVIVLSNDAQGIEIGFSPSGNAIFAQNFDFTRGEFVSANLSTLTPATDYELAILGSNYTLSTGGSSILSGNLRSYNAVAIFNPYQTANFIFLGDDTSQAQANINLGAVSITTVPFEFSPALGLGLIGAWGIARKLKSKSLKK